MAAPEWWAVGGGWWSDEVVGGDEVVDDGAVEGGLDGGVRSRRWYSRLNGVVRAALSALDMEEEDKKATVTGWLNASPPRCLCVCASVCLCAREFCFVK